MTSRIALTVAFLARLPLKLLLAFVGVSLLAGEWFPFSHYPMYANPGPNTWYVFVSDGNDQPIALRKSFRVSTPVLKKLYATRLQALPPIRQARKYWPSSSTLAPFSRRRAQRRCGSGAST